MTRASGHCSSRNHELKSESTLKAAESERHWDNAIREYIHGAPQRLWRTHSDTVNIAFLADWLARRKFARILKTDLFDEAVSEGLFPFLSGYGGVVQGIDITVESVQGARGRYPHFDTCCADVRNLPFEDACFELIVSNSTLDHFQSRGEIDQSLRELFRVLVQGGELVISLDNLQNPVVWLRSILPQYLLSKLRVIPYFVGKTHTRRGLISALHRAGFEVLETRPILHCPRVLAIQAAGLLQRWATARTQQGFLAFLNRFEALEKLPTRYFTGHFVAVRARKPATFRVVMPASRG